ncbi:2491_t:CDS:2 [Funneliformis geosporum]|uniref:12785_t:CDS:1 n=1 Tax=Funneliformis geosporum TaxID=1117311 RepID=A0A9W4SJQ6_9GLOM|nr:2491_t:CDS:2 [Funneliformis geosporum]CAI2170797.1 12785_t:CDS:2 [Funneliformis geosporum]
MATPQTDENAWTTFEKLLLIQAVYKHGDNWLAISRTMKSHPMVSHPSEFFTQKNCSTKYNTLVDPLKNEAEIEDEHKKRSGEYVNDKQRMPWTAKLARQLYHERIAELKSLITSDEQIFRKLVTEIDEIKSGQWDNKFAEAIKEEQKKKDQEKKVAGDNVSKILTVEVPKGSTDVLVSDANKAESLVAEKILQPAVNIDKNDTTATILEKETIINKNVEPQVARVKTKPSTEVAPTSEDMKYDESSSLKLSSRPIEVDEDMIQPRTPSTPLPNLKDNLIIVPSKSQNVQQVLTINASTEDDKLRRGNVDQLMEEVVDMMDIDDEKLKEKSMNLFSNFPTQESILETDSSKVNKATVSPNTEESVNITDTPRTVGCDIAMDIDEPQVEIISTDDGIESPSKVHLSESRVTSPISIEEVEITSNQENIIFKEQHESKVLPHKITANEKVEGKEIVGAKGKEQEISETKIKQSVGSTKEEVSPYIIESLFTEQETKSDKIENISVEIQEDDGEDVRMIDLSTLPEENEDIEKYISIGKAPTPLIELKEPSTSGAGLTSTTPVAVVSSTSSNAAPSPSGDLIPSTPPPLDTAPTPSGETPDDKKLKTWQKLVSMILLEISNHRFASVFQNPIRDQDAPGYYDIVKQSMDLRTLKKRLREGTIYDTNLFHRDLMLMFMNASVFNREETDIHQMALEMKDHVETLIAEFKRSEGTGGTHEPATRRKSMAIDGNEAAYFTSDRRSEIDRTIVTGSSRSGKFKNDAADQRQTKKPKRLSISKKSEKDI